jgi:cytochrome P450
MPTTFWLLVFILTSPKYYSLVTERIKSYMTPNSPSLFNLPDLLADPLLQACFQETLRLRMQNGSTRLVNESTTLPVNGREYFLRKGSVVFVPASLVHLDEEIYEDVKTWLPERFLGADLETSNVVTIGDGRESAGGKSEKKTGTIKFYKKGVPVKHYMMPFGGGDSLVISRLIGSDLTSSVLAGG